MSGNNRIPILIVAGSLLVIVSAVVIRMYFLQKSDTIKFTGDRHIRPNIIIIYSDDQGIHDLGIYGGKNIYTPNTDNLARRGVMFTQMYAPSSICSPSRAGLLTGRYPQRAGMPGNATPPPLRGINDREGHRNSGGLCSNQPSMAKILRDAGYRTAMIGKWHLGYDAGHRPDDHGFEHWFGHLGGVIDNYSHFFHWNGPTRHDLWRNGIPVHEPGRYFPDLMFEEAKQFLADHRHDPFFIYYSLNTPHWPYQADPYWLEAYQRDQIPWPRDLYGAFVSAQDERIGMLLDYIKDLGLLDHTIILFQSDNGHSVEEVAHFGGGDAGIYRGAKRGLFEGGIRVPSIISWPDRIPQNEVRNHMVHAMDWLPTLLDWLDIPLPEDEIDGKSLVNVIDSNDADEPHETLFWERTYRDQWVVRKGPWKLYANAFDQPGMAKLTDRDRELFLANLDQDPGEMVNMVDKYPDITRELRQLYQKWKMVVTLDQDLKQQ